MVRANHQPSEQQAVQQVLQHYAKTVYFNTLWKSFLSKIAALVCFMSFATLRRMHQSDEGIGFGAGFEVLSMGISLATVLFIQRTAIALPAFKSGFAFTLLQSTWWGYGLYQRSTMLQEYAELLASQLPFGSLYFLVCWASDRFMMRSEEQAKQTSMEVQQVVKKQQ